MPPTGCPPTGGPTQENPHRRTHTGGPTPADLIRPQILSTQILSTMSTQGTSRPPESQHSESRHSETPSGGHGREDESKHGREGGSLPMRRAAKNFVAGALGGGVFALVQHLGSDFPSGPDRLVEPGLARWVVLYALLGGLAVSAWKETTRWITSRRSLSRRGAIAASGLVAGTLIGSAALLVATFEQGAGAGEWLLLERLSLERFSLDLLWTDGLGGFVGGAVGGSLGRVLMPEGQH